jgi:LuxR family maltose regulon positive regulatory protein
LEQNGFLDEAIKHALLANDFTRSVVLIADLADPLWKRGEHVKLRLWLAKLPEEALCVQPELCIYQAWFLFTTGQQELAQQLLQAVEQDVESGRDQPRLRGRLGAIWSQISYWKEDIPGIVRYSGWAMEYLPPGDPWRNMAAMALGDARYFQGDVHAAYQTRLENLAASPPEDDLFFHIIANLKVASTLWAMAKLNEVIQICQQQFEFATQHGLLKTVFVGWALAIWAIVLAEQNELDQALEFAHQSLELNLGGDYALLSYSYLVLAIVYFRRGDYHNAEANLRTLAEIQQTHYIPFNTAGSLVGWQARVMLAQNRLDEAAQWIAAQDCEGDEKLFMTCDHVIVVRARLLLSQGNLDEAASLLARLGKACEDIGHTTRWIEILVLQALTHHMAGRMSLAHQYLGQSLALAEPGGFIRTFVDEGPPMARLLYEALSRGIAPDYTRRLLAAFPVTESAKAAPSNVLPPSDSLIEPLSERELEVLALLAEGLTNREIASRLYLAPNTVKAHTGNIYGKLDVHNRTQAVARARTLGLLPSI